MNDDMLALARKYQPEMARKLGEDRVAFHKGYIQDLALDVAALERQLAAHPVRSGADLQRLRDWQDEQRRVRPLIADGSIDLVISNCVLNLVREEDRKQLASEIFRVLKPGGRIAISDIVSDEPVPAHLKRDPALWTGCVSGAFQEEELLKTFLEGGFIAVRYDKWDSEPWRVVEGIEFRSVTLTGVKAETGCFDRGHAVIYRGPYSSITDDEGHVYPRGARMAVCERTYRFLMDGPYGQDFIGIAPSVPREPVTFCAPPGTRRPAAETKGGRHAGCGGGSGGCC
jgi:SAM-dependent methyltransferase